MRAFLYVSFILSIILLVATESPSPSAKHDDVSFGSNAKAVVDVQVPNMYAGLRGGSDSQVECYTCIGCTRVTADTPTKKCPHTNDFTKQSKCVTYVEKYESNEWYIRGCASVRSTCAEIKNAYDNHPGAMKLASCSECEGDRCNKSSLSHSLSGATITFFVIITPLLTKCTLS